jgi:site-specific DNA recombinase
LTRLFATAPPGRRTHDEPQWAHVYIYCRVSSAGQEDNTSLDTQEAACRAWAHERGLVVANVAREVWSGADRHRPELDALLDRLVPGDVVLAYALDRLSRSQIHTALLVDRIESAGASLALVTEDFEQSATGTFLRGAKSLVAELEREKIAERTQRGRRARVASGKPIAGGKPPFGYRWANEVKTHYLIDPEEAQVVHMVFDMAAWGASLRVIAATLEDRGITSPSGRSSWTAAAVRRLRTREMYSTGAATAFAIHYQRKPTGGYRQVPRPTEEQVQIADVAPTLVSPEQQAAVMSRLATNQSFATLNNGNPEATMLRAGFVRCGHCGWAIRVNNPTTPGNTARYCCNTYRKGRCANPVITAAPLDAAVWSAVASVLQDPEIIANAVENHRADGGLERQVDVSEKTLAAIMSKQGRVAKAIAAVDDDDAANPLIAELKSLSTRRAALEQERADLLRRIANAEADSLHLRSLSDWCAAVRENVDSLDYAGKRLAMEALGVQVRVWREGATTNTGVPLPRWDILLAPNLSDPSIVLHATSSTSGS